MSFFLSASNGFGFSLNNIYFIFFWLANSNYGKKDSTNDKYSSVKFVWEMSGKLLLLYICVLAYIFLFQACDKKNKFYNIFSPLFTVIMISNLKKNYFQTWFFFSYKVQISWPILTIIFITRYFRIFNFIKYLYKIYFFMSRGDDTFPSTSFMSLKFVRWNFYDTICACFTRA